ncbi:prepilin-type N-terminal cleavage/methylation domain-containing protein [Exiguobacterium sp. s162]|jgi:type IV pilus assembly protein PilA|uniref:prepilin-type N-terminal cleavage/methylation domain-containing protein n=1 Tax=Exiguobacterium sp. s162 TaxID=2751276 RepID=UPI001BEAF337|nr:prepilin-type N-terminal cleavage/methylation domain-containing protein [Exiguobacterium sp. s162]
MVEKLKMIWQDAKQLKDERGLTLVELLVVVVILGIIAAIAVVAIGGIIENSKKDAMVADAKQMVSSAKLYTASNPVEGETILNFLSADNSAASGSGATAVPAKVGAKSYISNMKDPFGSSDYSKAEVVITALTDGTYSYEVVLNGSKFTINKVNNSSLDKKSLTKVVSGG